MAMDSATLTAVAEDQHVSHLLLVILIGVVAWAAPTGIAATIFTIRLYESAGPFVPDWVWWIYGPAQAVQLGGPVGYVIGRWRTRPWCRVLRNSMLLSLVFSVPVVLFVFALAAAAGTSGM